MMSRSQEDFGVPPMDLSKIHASSSCSDGGTVVDGYHVGPSKSCTVQARHLLGVIRRFHWDHVQSISGMRDGFLGYHVKNFSPKNVTSPRSHDHFNEMGFVYDSVLSQDYGSSYILEMLRVDFSQGRSKPGSNLKRSLSLDDLDVIEQKNYQLDRKTLYLLGFDTDTFCENPRPVCDGCHFSENIECKFSRYTTIVQDDRVIRKLTFLKDGKGCVERETVSSPRCSSAEPLKMVDQYYAMQYAEKLFQRCHFGDVWEKLDFVHKKWLGELIDEESVLVSKNLKKIYLKLSQRDGCDKALQTDGYNPEYKSMKLKEYVDYNSSMASLNNMLVEGVAVFNGKRDDREGPTRNMKKCRMSGDEMRVDFGKTGPVHSKSRGILREPYDSSCEYNCYECTMDRSEILSNQTNNDGKECPSLKREIYLDKVWSSFKRRPNIPTGRRYAKSFSRVMNKKALNVSVSLSKESNEKATLVKSKRSWQDERDKRASLRKVEKWVNNTGNTVIGGESEIFSSSDEVGRKATKSMSVGKLRRDQKQTRIRFKKQTGVNGSGENSGKESSTSSSSSSTDSKEVSPLKIITVAVTEASTESSSTSKASAETLSKTVTTKKLVKASKSEQQVVRKKKKKKESGPNNTITKLVLRLLAREVQGAVGRLEPIKKHRHMGHYDSYIQLKNFCVVFREAQVLRCLVQEDTARPLTIAEKITKAIEDCKLACLKICRSSTTKVQPPSATEESGELSRGDTNEAKSPSCSGESSHSDVIANEDHVWVLSEDGEEDTSASSSSTSSSSSSSPSSSSASASRGDESAASSTLEESGSGANTRELSLETGVDEEHDQEESATTDTFEEETFHTAETFRLVTSVEHVSVREGHRSCGCQECRSIYREVSRLMGSDETLRSGAKWLRALPLKRALSRRRWLSGVRHTSSPKMAEAAAQATGEPGAGGAGRRSLSEELKKRSKSDGDVGDYMDAPKRAAKFLSLRKMAGVRGQKKRPKNSRGAVYKVLSKASNCRRTNRACL